MRFFVPLAEDDAQAERVFAAIAESNHRPIPPTNKRLFRLTYKHNGKNYVAEVGQPINAYYGVGGPVVAIFGGEPLLVCLATRGVNSGDPILVGVSSVSDIEYFAD
jgi:hypothetical protein